MVQWFKTVQHTLPSTACLSSSPAECVTPFQPQQADLGNCTSNQLAEAVHVTDTSAELD